MIAETILYIVGERGFSFSAAAEEVGISFRSLCRWRLQHYEFNLRLLNARRDYRVARLQVLQGATTRDGRPDWRAAAWELEHTHPEDYSLNPKRRAAFQQMRQDEAEEWEYLQAAYAAEQASRPAPESQKFQNSPSAGSPPPTGTSADATSSLEPDERHEMFRSSFVPQSPTDLTTPAAATFFEAGSVSKKFQNPFRSPLAPSAARSAAA